ncbi:sensor histidine kinase [Polyangium aurulentum]|uniref:sensor histidine kinase n=1 Tax=Polyangium aurulentum TaxID=2567896 RepID=UPI0010AE945D|nr:HAMP domain-containing sensor histidine kinase [Polyangium aurulentum]UQA57251.1 HAMP domain-containing histidine kinase [Polyangium aurulentum]
MDPNQPIDEGALLALPAQERVAAVFRESGYEVEQRVGDAEGTVDWFAIPKTGFVRPRTYFRTLPEPPEDVGAALAELEADREKTGADRAIAIVMAGKLPAGYELDLIGRTANLITFRRWFLEVSEIADQVREYVQRFERSGDHEGYLPRRARLASGQEIDVDGYIDAWLEDADAPSLIIEGSGATTTLNQAVYRAAKRFQSDPENVTPFMVLFGEISLHIFTAQAGFAVPAFRLASWDAPIRARSLYARTRPTKQSPQTPTAIVLDLIPPTADAVCRWFKQQLAGTPDAERVEAAYKRSKDLSRLLRTMSNLEPFLNAVRSRARSETPSEIDTWIASTMVAYMQQIESDIVERSGDDSLAELEDAALRQFALSSELDSIDTGRYILALHGWIDPRRKGFSNDLVRDYFLAKKIVSEVRAGNEELLLRYQFPQSVFLYLTLLAPDVAARLTGGAVGRMEEKIREEAERIAQLGFAHRLNRPVGAMRQYLGEIRDALGKDKRAELARPFARLEEEISYIANLAEKTRIWESGPSGTKQEVALRPLVEDELGPLQQHHTGVTCILDIPGEMRVLAIPEALHEALHCLLENAFHAATSSGSASSPRVTVSARRIGEVARLDVRDNGDGVDPADRDAIFIPFKTNKTGGTGKPRGTGLGLAIAKRFVEGMGGRIGLDADEPETCFFIELVAWKEGV